MDHIGWSEVIPYVTMAVCTLIIRFGGKKDAKDLDTKVTTESAKTQLRVDTMSEEAKKAIRAVLESEKDELRKEIQSIRSDNFERDKKLDTLVENTKAVCAKVGVCWKDDITIVREPKKA